MRAMRAAHRFAPPLQERPLGSNGSLWQRAPLSPAIPCAGRDLAATESWLWSLGSGALALEPWLGFRPSQRIRSCSILPPRAA